MYIQQPGERIYFEHYWNDFPAGKMLG